MSYIETPSLILLCASPGAGKSYMIRYLLTTMCKRGKFNYGIIITGTDFDGEYSNIIDDQYIYSGWDEQLIQDVMDMQINAGGMNAPPMFIVLDDCLGMVDFSSTVWVELVSRHRHYNITPIIAVQHLLGIKSPLTYNCARYCIMFKQTSEKAIKTLYSYFGQCFNTWKEFRTYLDANTKDYATLVYDAKGNTNTACTYSSGNTNSSDGNVSGSTKSSTYYKFTAPSSYKKYKFTF